MESHLKKLITLFQNHEFMEIGDYYYNQMFFLPLGNERILCNITQYCIIYGSPTTQPPCEVESPLCEKCTTHVSPLRAVLDRWNWRYLPTDSICSWPPYPRATNCSRIRWQMPSHGCSMGAPSRNSIQHLPVRVDWAPIKRSSWREVSLSYESTVIGETSRSCHLNPDHNL